MGVLGNDDYQRACGRRETPLQGTDSFGLLPPLHLGGDHVPLREIRVVEDLANQPLGEKMLNEHLINGLTTDVRVEGLLTDGEKVVKGRLKLFVTFVGFRNFFVQAACKLGNAVLELQDRLLKPLDIRLCIGIEIVQQVAESLRLCQLDSQHCFPALVEYGPPRVLEDRVDERIAFLDLLSDFNVQVVVSILRFPIASRQFEVVPERSVGEDGLSVEFQLLFWDEHPVP